MSKTTNPYHTPSRLANGLSEKDPNAIRARVKTLCDNGLDKQAMILLGEDKSVGWAFELLNGDSPAANNPRSIKAALVRLETAMLEIARRKAVDASQENDWIGFLGQKTQDALTAELTLDKPNWDQRRLVVEGLKALNNMRSLEMRNHRKPRKTRKAPQDSIVATEWTGATSEPETVTV